MLGPAPGIGYWLDEERKAKALLEDAQRNINAIQKECKHEWSEEYTPVLHKGYHIPASGHGSDRQMEQWVADEYTPSWTRKCPKCKKVEHTTRKEDIVKKEVKPVW